MKTRNINGYQQINCDSLPFQFLEAFSFQYLNKCWIKKHSLIFSSIIILLSGYKITVWVSIFWVFQLLMLKFIIIINTNNPLIIILFVITCIQDTSRPSNSWWLYIFCNNLFIVLLLDKVYVNKAYNVNVMIF